MSKLFALPTKSKSQDFSLRDRKIPNRFSIYNRDGESQNNVAQKNGSTHPADGTLPISVTAGDIREVVQLLRRKPSGVKVTKALTESHKRIFDLRKISAFEKLKIIEKDGQVVKLSAFGRNFASKLGAETEMYRDLIITTPVYKKGLFWIKETGRTLVTVEDLGAHWSAAKSKELNQPIDPTAHRESAVTFFQICQAADFGTMTLGKRGRMTRLMVDLEEIDSFVAGAFALQPGIARDLQNEMARSEEYSLSSEAHAPEKAKVLVITGENEQLAEQIGAALELADVSFQILRGKGRDIFSADESIREAFASCKVGCLLVGEQDVEKSGQDIRLRESIICEIGAVLLTYQNCLVLISTQKPKMPEILSEIPFFQIENCELSWATAVRIVRALKEMKR